MSMLESPPTHPLAPRRPLPDALGCGEITDGRIAADDGWKERLREYAVSRGRFVADKLLSGHTFFMLWLFIGVVSALDAGLTVRFQNDLRYLELNGVARWLLFADGWNPSLLIGVKSLGTTLVLGFLVAVYFTNRVVAQVLTGCVAAFQLWLLLFLSL